MAHFRKYKTSKGDIRYRAEVRFKGAKPFSKSFRLLGDAKIWAKNQDEKAQRLSAGIEEYKQYTITEAIDRYIRESLPPRNGRVALRLLNWWKDEIGNRHLDTLRPSELIELRTKLMEQPAHISKSRYGVPWPRRNPDGTVQVRAFSTVQKYMDQLSTIFNKAINEWEWTTYNPVTKIKKLKYNNERTRFLSDHIHLWPEEETPRHWDLLSDAEKQDAKERFPRAYELPRLIDALKSQKYKEKIQNNKPLWAYYLFVIQLGTGLRLSEATHMVWEENDLIKYPIVIVDMNRFVLLLKATKKDSTPRLKPISKEAIEVLKILYQERLRGRQQLP